MLLSGSAGQYPPSVMVLHSSQLEKSFEVEPGLLKRSLLLFAVQTLCLIVSSLPANRWARSPVPDDNLLHYKAPANPASRTKWDDVRTSARCKERQVDVLLSRITLIVVQKVGAVYG